MRASARVAAFGAALGVAFGLAALAGASIDPLRDDIARRIAGLVADLDRW